MLDVLAGGIFGVAGSVIKEGVSYFHKKQEAKIEKERRSDEIELAKILAEKETAVEAIKAATASQVASYKQDVDMGKPSQWVVNIKQLVRPSITVYSLIFVTIVWFTLSLDNTAERIILVEHARQLSNVTVGWWFGVRFFKAMNG